MKKTKRNHSTKQTIDMLQVLEISKIKSLSVAYTGDLSSNNILGEYQIEMNKLHQYLLKNLPAITDYVKCENAFEFYTDDHKFFMNCVRYCNTFDDKYLM